ncbi:hypothetical protein MASR1M90_22560 [Desulfovibrionales bacterium]
MCYITELANTPHDADISIARARVAPGVTTRWHALAGITERYVILSGQGGVEIGDAPPTSMSPCDVAVIPSDTRQRITNTGTADLIFLALCSPRIRPECYQDLE